LNFSTTSSSFSTSCSNSIADSAIDVLGGEDRRARAHGDRQRVGWARVDLDLGAAVDGELIDAKKVLSRSSVTETLVQRVSSSPSMSHRRSWVIGRGVEAPCSFMRIARPRGVQSRSAGTCWSPPSSGERWLLAHHVEAHPVDDHLLHESASIGRARAAPC